ncbi:hypothetical protein FGB62_18g32 [Gracilaria domingensis]|nr:hypothetical protein FGB62_18g32 [Gracilaria domingensis]
MAPREHKQVAVPDGPGKRARGGLAAAAGAPATHAKVKFMSPADFFAENTNVAGFDNAVQVAVHDYPRTGGERARLYRGRRPAAQRVA